MNETNQKSMGMKPIYSVVFFIFISVQICFSQNGITPLNDQKLIIYFIIKYV